MTYYKLTCKKDGCVYYASCELPIKPEKICEFIGLDGYTAEIVSKEEYDKEI